MSPYLYHEIARARQQEIAARTVHSHGPRQMHGSGGPRGSVRRRLSRAVAALSVCLAVPIAVVAGAQANPSSVKHDGRVSAAQYATEIRALEAKGYVPASCTTAGTLMRNYRAGRSVTVKL